MSNKIKVWIESFNVWMGESLDNRCCCALAAIGLGFWVHIIRINLG